MSLLRLILLPLLSLDAGISGDEELNVQDSVFIDDMDTVFYTAIIQYCLSYHNEGCGFGLYEFGAAKPWENNIVRNNIFIYDGSLVYPGQKIKTELFQGNCFWNLKEMFELAPGSQDIVGTSIPLGTGYDIGAIGYTLQSDY